jgi:hypothetical protein
MITGLDNERDCRTVIEDAHGGYHLHLVNLLLPTQSWLRTKPHLSLKVLQGVARTRVPGKRPALDDNGAERSLKDTTEQTNDGDGVLEQVIP